MVKIRQTGLQKLNFEKIPKKRIFRFLLKISAGHGWSWKFFFANFQILGPLGCQGWVVMPQNEKKSQNHCTLLGNLGLLWLDAGRRCVHPACPWVEWGRHPGPGHTARWDREPGLQEGWRPLRGGWWPLLLRVWYQRRGLLWICDVGWCCGVVVGRGLGGWLLWRQRAGYWREVLESWMGPATFNVHCCCSCLSGSFVFLLRRSARRGS